jgi:alkylation response protein AidB-like acyl-CoA dehydrogenase
MPITLEVKSKIKIHYLNLLQSGFGALCLRSRAGSDANSGKKTAVLSEDGTHYSITDSKKMWISNAGFCSLFIVLLVGDDKTLQVS